MRPDGWPRPTRRRWWHTPRRVEYLGAPEARAIPVVRRSVRDCLREFWRSVEEEARS